MSRSVSSKLIDSILRSLESGPLEVGLVDQLIRVELLIDAGETERAAQQLALSGFGLEHTNEVRTGKLQLEICNLSVEGSISSVWGTHNSGSYISTVEARLLFEAFLNTKSVRRLHMLSRKLKRLPRFFEIERNRFLRGLLPESAVRAAVELLESWVEQHSTNLPEISLWFTTESGWWNSELSRWDWTGKTGEQL